MRKLIGAGGVGIAVAGLALILAGGGCRKPNPFFQVGAPDAKTGDLDAAHTDEDGRGTGGAGAGGAGAGGAGAGGAGAGGAGADANGVRDGGSPDARPPLDAASGAIDGAPGASDTLPVAVGTGVRGEYFNEVDFSAPVLTRLDPSIDFDWGRGAPAPGVHEERFSVRWTGMIQAGFTETYTFFTESDDGCRLWIDGVKVIEDWQSHSVQETFGTIELVAGRFYDLKMEYFDATFYAVAKLAWASRSRPKQIVPTVRLYPP